MMAWRTLVREHDDDGFSLLEVIISSAILLATVTALTLCVVSVSRGGLRMENTMDADRALLAQVEHLRALAFCAEAYPQAPPSASPPDDLLAAVFPHACPDRNSSVEYYVDDARSDQEPAGCFVTLVVENGVQLRRVARFLACPDGPALGADALRAWDARRAQGPPADSVLITLRAETQSRSISIVRSALSQPTLVAPEAGR